MANVSTHSSVTLSERWVVLLDPKTGICFEWTSNPLSGLYTNQRESRLASSGMWDINTVYHIIDPITAIMRGLVEPNEFQVSEGFKAWFNIIRG